MDVQPPPCDESLYRTGLGVDGRVNGYYMHVGNERFLRQSDIKVEHAGADRAAIDERGCSSLYIAVDGKLAGLVAYEDRIRPESRQVIETLYGMGIRDTIMLTGDNTAVADAVGQRLGLTRQIANMLPSDKAEVIQQLQRDGRLVAVVGDGINDSELAMIFAFCAHSAAFFPIFVAATMETGKRRVEVQSRCQPRIRTGRYGAHPRR
jgi:cation transport ATPase